MPEYAAVSRGDGWTRLTNMVDEVGEADVLDRFSSMVAIGESPIDVVRSMGIPWYVFRKWLEDELPRMEMFALAKRCYADKLAWDAISEVKDAVIEEVQLAKLKSDKYEKMAGKMDAIGWGDRKESVVLNTVNGVDAALDGFALALLDRMRVVQTVHAVPDEVVIDED